MCSPTGRAEKPENQGLCPVGSAQNYVAIHNNQSLSFASSMGECLMGLLDPGDSVCPTYALSSVSASQSGVGLSVSQSAAASIRPSRLPHGRDSREHCSGFSVGPLKVVEPWSPVLILRRTF